MSAAVNTLNISVSVIRTPREPEATVTRLKTRIAATMQVL